MYTDIRITKNKIILKKAPKQDIKNGLKLMSINFLSKENPRGMMEADLVSGKRHYSLPPGLRGKDLKLVYALM